MKQLLSEKSGLKSVTPPPLAEIDETVKQLEESAKKRETELQAKLKDATQKIDEISLECDQLRSSKSSLLKKYEQKVFDENEALYRKLRRSENDLRLITSQIDQLRLEYQAQEDAKRKLQDELKLAESQRQEQDAYVKNIKADYDKLLVSKNEDYKYSNRIEHLQNELDKKQDELFEAKKVSQKAQLRHEAECDELQRRLDEAVDSEAEKNKLEVQRLEADYDQRIRDLRQEKTELENNLEEAKNQIESQKGKEQWEQYLGNIVQWVYDEKDARAYLEQLANRMSDELEALKEWSFSLNYFYIILLKMTPNKAARNSQTSLQKHINFSVSASATNGGSNNEWKTMRRHKIKNSQLLELQSTLQDEIQLRHEITSQLTAEQQNNQRLEMENIELKQKLSELMIEDPTQSASSGARSNSPVPSFHSSTELPSRSAKAPQILSMNDPRLVSNLNCQSY